MLLSVNKINLLRGLGILLFSYQLAISTPVDLSEYEISSIKHNTTTEVIPLDLYSKLALFGKVLTSDQQQTIVLTATYNDLRFYENDSEERCKIVQTMWKDITTKLTFHLEKINFIPTQNNWQDQILIVVKELSRIPGTKPLERSILLNMWLSKAGLCPLVRFAFDQWYEIYPYHETYALKLIENLADLSTTFLYRLIKIENREIGGEKIGHGAYSNVFLNMDKQSIIKVPKNLASQSFAADEEYLASLYIENSSLSQYVPHLLYYDREKKVLERQYIRGKTGFELLKEEGQLLNSPKVIKQLKEIYDEACKIYYKDSINFDIHPGNLIWSEDFQKWFLVDLGPMPEIGAEYFPRENFENYFQKIWLDLLFLMTAVPIRSLDIEIHNDKLEMLRKEIFYKN